MLSNLPYIKSIRDGEAHHLIVDGAPFILRAAELHNSSSSSPAYMSTVWPRLAAMHINTVLGAICWDRIEPVEGQFDFSDVQKIIHGAQEHQLKLVFLWFGAYKNGQSCYAPAWVKTNVDRFPRAKTTSKGVVEVLSLFSPEAVRADARAFAALLQFLRDNDPARTVIMVQVENEIGLLGDSRDRSLQAEQAFRSNVPPDLLQGLSAHWGSLNSILRDTLSKPFPNGLPEDRLEAPAPEGTWTEVFGQGVKTDELFMAYHYAKYVETVASAGKAILPLPMFTNAWLRNIDENDQPVMVGGGVNPGDYPSGGPVETVLDVYQIFAPSLDFVSPDIYFANHADICGHYRHRKQPLFIPEQRRDEYGALTIWQSIGAYQAIGTAPFGIDSVDPATSPFIQHYELLRKVTPFIVEARNQGWPIHGFFFERFAKGDKDPSKPMEKVKMGDWDVVIMRAHVFGHPEPGYGLIINTSVDTFLLVGEGFQAIFVGPEGSPAVTGILDFTELEIVDESTGKWREGRHFNGDETRSGNLVVMPSANPDHGDFIIHILIPALTRVGRVRVYTA